jgi:hypothetical protein
MFFTKQWILACDVCLTQWIKTVFKPVKEYFGQKALAKHFEKMFFFKECFTQKLLQTLKLFVLLCESPKILAKD